MNDLTPAYVEARMRKLVNELALAQSTLAKARNAEVDAKHVFEAARRRAMLSDEAPKVSRGGVTTAYRDAWVDAQCADEQRDFEIKQVIREAAQDHLRTLRDQAMLMMALSKSLTTSMGLVGVAS